MREEKSTDAEPEDAPGAKLENRRKTLGAIASTKEGTSAGAPAGGSATQAKLTSPEARAADHRIIDTGLNFDEKKVEVLDRLKKNMTQDILTAELDIGEITLDRLFVLFEH